MESGNPLYELKLTNLEVRSMFLRMARGWFQKVGNRYNDFIKALLLDVVEYMNEFINIVSEQLFRIKTNITINTSAQAPT